MARRCNSNRADERSFWRVERHGRGGKNSGNTLFYLEECRSDPIELSAVRMSLRGMPNACPEMSTNDLAQRFMAQKVKTFREEKFAHAGE